MQTTSSSTPPPSVRACPENLPQASLINWLNVAVIVCFVMFFRIGWRGVRAIEPIGNYGCPYLLPFGMFLLGHSGYWPCRWEWHGCDMCTHSIVNVAMLTRAVTTQDSSDVLESSSPNRLFLTLSCSLKQVPYPILSSQHFWGMPLAIPHNLFWYSILLGLWGLVLNDVKRSVHLSVDLR